MIRSIFALHPYLPEVTQHGCSSLVKTVETVTFSTFVPRTSFICLHKASYSFSRSVSRVSPSKLTSSLLIFTSFFSLKDGICCKMYSSIGSVIRSTSKPRCFKPDTNGELMRELAFCPVI